MCETNGGIHARLCDQERCSDRRSLNICDSAVSVDRQVGCSLLQCRVIAHHKFHRKSAPWLDSRSSEQAQTGTSNPWRKIDQLYTC